VRTIYKEVPYLQGEQVEISNDVYGMTIGVNIRNENEPGKISPTEYIFCLRQCAFVFVLQIAIASFFAINELMRPQYPIEVFSWSGSIIRILAGTLLQIQLNAELKGALQIMIYLKQQEVTPRNQTTRYINLMLCFMQCSTPILVQIMFTIQAAQELNMRMVIKGYATIALVITIDNRFGANFPSSVKKNAAYLNDPDTFHLELTDDNNASWDVLKRYWRSVKAFTGTNKLNRPIIPVQNEESFQLMSLEKRKRTLQK
jgi:hypothetical protein